MSAESRISDAYPGLQVVVGSVSSSNEIPVHLTLEPDGSFVASATEFVGHLDEFGGNPTQLLVRVRTPGLIRAVLQFADGRIQVDRARTKLTVDNQPTDINTTPFRLLMHFAEHLDEPQSAVDLLESVWESEWPIDPVESKKADNLIHSNVRRVREALGSPLVTRL